MTVIEQLFAKDINRDINGVVKAESLDEAVVYQELSEYVLTKELTQLLGGLVDHMTKVADNLADQGTAEKIGVWISGFFGSGKSHFLKIIGYILAQREVRGRPAVDYLIDHLDDPLLTANLRRMVAPPTDVVLFNIDARKDNQDENALLGVFVRVFNESLGLCGAYPHIAEMERTLQQQGVYGAFAEAFALAARTSWEEGRDSYVFYRESMIQALVSAGGFSADSAAKIIDSEGHQATSIKGFATMVAKYLDSRGPSHRMAFLVDEVGQFIGNDRSLMLNLQTIVEELGSICRGRAWVFVTSQEDFDSLFRDSREARSNDFSKIQGRFQARLSLSSSYTDEVLQLRLLEKKDEHRPTLRAIFADQATALKNLLRFDSGGPTMPFWRDADDFAASYPFPRHHFDLVQKIFESIRRVGAAGLHLSRGERSLMDAFQTAAQAHKANDIGVLVPLSAFYPCIRNFLDGTISRTITKAEATLSPEEMQVLVTLFLIRYNDQVVKATVDNLVTLCVDHIDADRIALRNRIEAALGRLEKECLIQRQGASYQFLTHEEQDVRREIGHIQISSSEEIRLVSELVWQDVLRDASKHRFARNKRDYAYDRVCDNQVTGKAGNELRVEVVTPLGDDYITATKSWCVARSNAPGRIVIKLPDTGRLGSEVQTYLQTNAYVLRKRASASPSMKTILQAQMDLNAERKAAIIRSLGDLLVQAEVYIASERRDIIGGDGPRILSDALDYCIENLYPKMPFIQHGTTSPQDTIAHTLLTADPATVRTAIQSAQGNPQAVEDMRQYLRLVFEKGRKLLSEVVERYTRAPYGWVDWEAVVVVAQLCRLGECRLVVNAVGLEGSQAVEALTKPREWANIAVMERQTADTKTLQAAGALCRSLFGQIGPSEEDALAQFIRGHLRSWSDELRDFEVRISHGGYPGAKDCGHCQMVIGPLLTVQESAPFLAAVVAASGDLTDLFEEDLADLRTFFSSQTPLWDRIQACLRQVAANEDYLLRESPAALAAVTALRDIARLDRPFSRLSETDGLITAIDLAIASLIHGRRRDGLVLIRQRRELCVEALEAVGADADWCHESLAGFTRLEQRVEQEGSIPHLQALTGDHLASCVDFAICRAAEWERRQREPDAPPPPPPAPPVAIRASDYAVKPVIESAEDVEDYVHALRSKLLEAVANGSRVRVQ